MSDTGGTSAAPNAREKNFYYDVVYMADWLSLAMPFMLAASLFYLVYWLQYRSYSSRVRTKKMVSG